MLQNRQSEGIFHTPQQQKQQQYTEKKTTTTLENVVDGFFFYFSMTIDMMIQFHLQLSNPESRWHRWYR